MKSNYRLVLALLAGTALGATAIQGLHAQAKPPAYLIFEVDVTDPALYKTYIEHGGALLKSFGGRYLARGEKTDVFAGEPPKRVVGIIAFENMEKVQTFRDSAAYKEIAPIRDKSSKFRGFIVEGLTN